MATQYIVAVGSVCLGWKNVSIFTIISLRMQCYTYHIHTAGTQKTNIPIIFHTDNVASMCHKDITGERADLLAHALQRH